MGKSDSKDKHDEGKMIVVEGTRENTDRIVRAHVLWAMGAGLIPIPLFDIAAVTAIQIDALQKLAEEQGIYYSSDGGKRFVTALTGGTFARLGASLIKGVPGVGTVIGGLSMSAMSAASTYAVCQVALHHFRNDRNFLSFDLDDAKGLYEKALEQGKSFVKSLEKEVDPKVTKETYRNLEKLKELRDAEVLTEEEFERKKAKLLEKL
ncbi:SHOCT domain-containing protein [Roseibacillus persicicus]|uniref:SHOCT domain-containing protein n=1 Tax=Roseibacillus persicicus TaxID=454148 RepID=UPI00281274F4|nr:SHOCT domain-containing protein [Roseibacillus persicicus]